MTEIYESRDAAKRRLRSGVIEGTKREGNKKPSLLVYVAGALLGLLVTAAVLVFASRTLSENYIIDWEYTEGESRTASDAFKGYEAFGGGVIKYTKDGAEYLDKNGNFVWDRSYQMSSPIADVSGDYAVIADQGSTRMYIFDTAGLSGALDTLLPVSKVRISAGGVVYAVLDDDEASYISAFNKDGTALDLSVKSILTGDGYPFDIDISPDGTELITSYISVAGGEIVNNVVFRNFSSIGSAEDARRVVGGFSDEFEGHIAGKVSFPTDSLAQALYDGGVVFFSTKVLNSPEILANQTITGEMLSAATGEELTAVIAKKAPGEESEETSPYELLIYLNSRGTLKGSSDIDSLFDSMLVSSDSVVLYDKNEIRVYTSRGRLTASLSFAEGSIDRVIASSRKDQLFVVSENSIYKISF